MVAILIGVFSILLFSSSTLVAEVIHIGTMGTDSPTCGAINTPCQTLNVATENVGSGSHVIKIATGNYFHSDTIPPISSGLTIQGGWNDTFTSQTCDPAKTVFFADSVSGLSLNINSGDDLAVDLECLRFTRLSVVTGNGVALSAQDTGSSLNFTMRHCIVDSHTSGGISIQSSNSAAVIAAIEDSRVYNNNYPAGSPGRATGLAVSSLSGGSIEVNLERNRFTNNISAENSGGLFFQATGTGSLQATLLNNIIVGNQGDFGGGINIHSDASAALLEVTLTNNTIFNNSANNGGGLYINAAGNPRPVKLRNTIVWGNSASLTDGGDDVYLQESYFPGIQSGLNVDYSIVGDIYEASPLHPFVYGANNLSVDPILTSSYLLQSASPAINTGQCGYNSTSYNRVAPYDDIEADIRPGFGQLTGCDIGADEYASLLCFPVKSKQGQTTMICF